MNKKPTVLMILDGYGFNDKEEGNAVKHAKMPVLNKIFSEYPWKKGYASGMAVGLPDGQMGNSEVGHLNMGAGRIVYQELTRITKEIIDGTFYKIDGLVKACEDVNKSDSALHLFGLLSDGGVHSHNTHLYGLLELAKQNNVKKVFVHVFLDGRDTAPDSGKGFMEELEAKMKEIGVGKIASVMGRYYAMDRDNRWDRVEKAYKAMTNDNPSTTTNAIDFVANSYKNNVLDEFIVPTTVVDNNQPIGLIKDNDTVIFFNFRPDRAREITRAFCDDEFNGFERPNGRLKLNFVCFSDYDKTINNKSVIFEKTSLANTFGEYLSKLGKTQLRMAETEKYAHVTFFFNGGKEEPYEGEDRILVPSPKVATYDLQPEMSANEVGDKLANAIKSMKYDLIVINFANPDMVGHTGILDAAVKALEAVDNNVGKALEAILEVNGTMFICADHGNAEQLIDYDTKGAFTAHTTNPVPFILVNGPKNVDLAENGVLADIAPTLLDIMGIPQPAEMTGKSLLVK